MIMLSSNHYETFIRRFLKKKNFVSKFVFIKSTELDTLGNLDKISVLSGGHETVSCHLYDSIISQVRAFFSDILSKSLST